MSATPFRYVQGHATAVASGSIGLLVGIHPDDPLVDLLLDALDGPTPLDDVFAALFRGGIGALPPFALVARSDHGLRVLLRGPFYAVADGGAPIRPQSGPWTDLTVSARHLALHLEGSAPGESVRFRGGSVQAGELVFAESGADAVAGPSVGAGASGYADAAGAAGVAGVATVAAAGMASAAVADAFVPAEEFDPGERVEFDGGDAGGEASVGVDMPDDQAADEASAGVEVPEEQAPEVAAADDAWPAGEGAPVDALVGAEPVDHPEDVPPVAPEGAAEGEVAGAWEPAAAEPSDPGAEDAAWLESIFRADAADDVTDVFPAVSDGAAVADEGPGGDEPATELSADVATPGFDDVALGGVSEVPDWFPVTAQPGEAVAPMVGAAWDEPQATPTTDGDAVTADAEMVEELAASDAGDLAAASVEVDEAEDVPDSEPAYTPLPGWEMPVAASGFAPAPDPEEVAPEPAGEVVDAPWVEGEDVVSAPAQGDAAFPAADLPSVGAESPSSPVFAASPDVASAALPVTPVMPESPVSAGSPLEPLTPEWLTGADAAAVAVADTPEVSAVEAAVAGGLAAGAGLISTVPWGNADADAPASEPPVSASSPRRLAEGAWEVESDVGTEVPAWWSPAEPPTPDPESGQDAESAEVPVGEAAVEPAPFDPEAWHPVEPAPAGATWVPVDRESPAAWQPVEPASPAAWAPVESASPAAWAPVEPAASASDLWRPTEPAASEGAPLVWAVRCGQGHLSPASATVCRTCHAAIPAQQRFEAPRPLLGVLRLSTGAAVRLDGDLVLGRNPRVPEGHVGPEPALVVVADPNRDISGQHLSVTLDYWNVLVRDLGSTNGTQLLRAGAEPLTLHPGEAVLMELNDTLVMADSIRVVYEVE